MATALASFTQRRAAPPTAKAITGARFQPKLRGYSPKDNLTSSTPHRAAPIGIPPNATWSQNGTGRPSALDGIAATDALLDCVMALLLGRYTNYRPLASRSTREIQSLQQED